MHNHVWADPAALSTAPIFEDAIYLAEALQLPATQNEDDLDLDLALLARESGIHDPYRFLCPVQNASRALSTLTLDSDPRSSMSIHSQETQSTSLSALSRASYSVDRSPAQRMLPKLARASLSAENYRHAKEGLMPSMQRHSTSTLSVKPSALSSSPSLPNLPPRKKRGSALFAMFRKDSSPCASRAHRGYNSKSRGEKLDCGHSLSAFEIRVHIQEALRSGRNAVPNCCGTALPQSVLESVLTKDEIDVAMNSSPQSPSTGSLRDSGYYENGSQIAQSLDSFSFPAPGPNVPRTPVQRARHEVINIDYALANEAFNSIRSQQKEQFARITTFECNQRAALSAHHQYRLKQLASQHVKRRAERMEQHSCELEQLEEMQIVAEHDLRQAQDQETQNVATALKHMQAYCLGTNANHPEHAHIVSEEDFRKLDRQRLVQQNLPRKFENAINVLRARQERQIKRKLQKQEDELDALDAEHEKQKSLKETEYSKELGRLESIIEARRKRLLQRWDLKFEIWRREWEEQHSTTLTAKLEHEDWPLSKSLTTPPPISPESALTQYVQATA